MCVLVFMCVMCPCYYMCLCACACVCACLCNCVCNCVWQAVLIVLCTPPCGSFLFLSAVLSLSCRSKQHGTCFKREPLALTTDSAPGSLNLRPSRLVHLLKLATFHKQFHKLVRQLGVYWKMADFPLSGV